MRKHPFLILQYENEDFPVYRLFEARHGPYLLTFLTHSSYKKPRKGNEKFKNINEFMKAFDSAFDEDIHYFHYSSTSRSMMFYEYPFSSSCELIGEYFWMKFHDIYREIFGKEFNRKNISMRVLANYDSRIYCRNVKELASFIKVFVKLRHEMLELKNCLEEKIKKYCRENLLKYTQNTDILRHCTTIVSGIYLPVADSYKYENFTIRYVEEKNCKRLLVRNGKKTYTIPFENKKYAFKELLNGSRSLGIVLMTIPDRQYVYREFDKLVNEISR